ncbi:hypothetical protein DRO97_01750 [Archaeoglobales archaeon]|nr:MAG: hypothetical protein DRO97_01750 [Archaeoglobales archaeon]
MPVYVCEVELVPKRRGIDVFVTGENTAEAHIKAISKVAEGLKESRAEEFLTFKLISCKPPE